jgi:hypothetical protein
MTIHKLGLGQKEEMLSEVIQDFIRIKTYKRHLH